MASSSGPSLRGFVNLPLENKHLATSLPQHPLTLRDKIRSDVAVLRPSTSCNGQALPACNTGCIDKSADGLVSMICLHLLCLHIFFLVQDVPDVSLANLRFVDFASFRSFLLDLACDPQQTTKHTGMHIQTLLQCCRIPIPLDSDVNLSNTFFRHFGLMQL